MYVCVCVHVCVLYVCACVLYVCMCVRAMHWQDAGVTRHIGYWQKWVTGGIGKRDTLYNPLLY